MIDEAYRSQIELLLDVLPSIAAERVFVMHGGTAINLFVCDMPRLSVDIDLIFAPIEDRKTSLAKIATGLEAIGKRLAVQMPGARVSVDSRRAKIAISNRRATIKVEVNTVMRGTLGEPTIMTLSQRAQARFDRYVEMPVVPIGQLYGGKVCAALDRQHPRDIFDVRHMMATYGLSGEIKRGFLFCLLSTDRPSHEILGPTLLDQRILLTKHFAGMSEEPLSYDEFERARGVLVQQLHDALDSKDRELIVSFTAGSPRWAECGYEEFDRYPAIQWKLLNIRKLKATNPAKHRDQLRNR